MILAASFRVIALVQTLEFVKHIPTLGSDAAMQKQLISRALVTGIRDAALASPHWPSQDIC
ncbi:hypothetical protein [Bradyrhizobium sp. CIR48]|uniref:hypothetical protein n=1 Tax=Bradyrhizobium sp. CIR48 TaxID=2663840 RepID=UPI001AEEB2F4|nr:hypothetical protein [Bradyrhizobium sp. CIR48]